MNPLFTRRYLVGMGLFFALLIGVVFLTLNRHATSLTPAPPLPFDTNMFVASKRYMPAFALTLPRNASVATRLIYLYWKAREKIGLHSASTWSFPASPMALCGVQPALDQCMEVNGTRYLMPIGVAVGGVHFGHTNVLDGPHWVAAFENALQSNNVECWNPQTKQTAPEHLVLLRFPAQKVVVVLPEAAAVEFQRTNGIHLTAEKAGR